MYLPEYDLSVYVDANIRIIGDFNEYIDTYMGDSKLLCVKHPDRTNVRQEAEECIRLSKDDESTIRNQVSTYKQEGFPDSNGLIASGVLVRNHNDAVLSQIMDDWWNEVKEKSLRDQLSFNYCCWKHNYSYAVSDVHVNKNDYWVCPGIHTKNIEMVEDALIDSMLLAAYRGYYITQLENEINTLKDAIDKHDNNVDDMNG